MRKNRKKVLLIVVLVMTGIITSLKYKSLSRPDLKEDNGLNKSLAIYLANSSGSYTLSDLTKIPESGYIFNKGECSNGGTVTWDETNKNISVSTSKQEKCNLYFDIIKYNANDILAALKLTSKTGNPDFNSSATTDETSDGLYSMEDDYGTSYYFRGAVENNYVKFANYFWRIIRINGDGSLRIIYDGTSAHANGESSEDRAVGTSTFNSLNIDNAYVGYMYGLAGVTTAANRCLMLENDTVTDKVSIYASKSACENAGGKWTTTAYEATHANVKDSTIKEYLDDWYKTNIVDKGFSNVVSDEIFCNDRSMGTSYNIGTGTSTTSYGAYNRLYLETNKTPKLTCTQKNDAFTVSDTTSGNGDLEYPIGLITADEVSLAGGLYNTYNSNYYLYKGGHCWSNSPQCYERSAIEFNIISNDSLNSHSVYITNKVVPVINLSPQTAQTLIGTGIATDPFRLP